MAYCSSCGKKNVEQAKFCVYCGEALITAENRIEIKKNTGLTKKAKKPQGSAPRKALPKKKLSGSGSPQKKRNKDYFEIEIPGVLGSKIVKFDNDKITYKNTTIYYKDITGISCKQIYHSTNLIPTHQDFSFSFYSSDESINLSFGTTLQIGSKSRKMIFFKLYTISKKFFVPLIAEKLIYQMTKQNKTIQIGSVYFNKQGYYKKKLLGFGGEDWVHWTDNIGEPGMESGCINIYKAEGDKYKHFSSIPLETMNAIVIPELIVGMYSITNAQ